jgi:hypothetical protein
MDSSQEKLLRAIYETKRQQILLAWLSSESRNVLDPALVFAYSCRMYPIIHIGGRIDAFEGIYDIDKQFVTSVTNYVDSKLMKKDFANLTFYEIEDLFNGDRMQLIDVFRYLFLCDLPLFNEDFFAKLLEKTNCPSEASGICYKLEIGELNI